MTSDSSTPGRKQLNILVVDDELGSRTVLSIMLRLAGHTAFLAEGGRQALEIFDQTPIDLIITDHHMPGMNGLDLVLRLRERGFAGEICVVTGFIQHLDQQSYNQLGVPTVMPKPLDTRRLKQWIEIHSAPK